MTGKPPRSTIANPTITSPAIDISEGVASSPPLSNHSNKAVALHYDRAEDNAPRVVATGRGYVADQIIALAFAHGIRVREDADLVEILATLEVDSVIPLEAFTAVAEILSYVYRANALYGKPAHATSPQDAL